MSCYWHYTEISMITMLSFQTCTVCDKAQNTLTFGLRSKKLWYLNRSRRTSFSFTSCSISDLEESSHLHKDIQRNTHESLPQSQSLHRYDLSQLTPGWSWPCPGGTVVCTSWPQCLVRWWAGWRRGCRDCLRTADCLQTMLRWGTEGCRPESHR